jgi:LacI family transcriptional regulator
MKEALHTTLADIAKAADCSTASVSLALRDDQRVAEATRTRIQALARKLGYKPNPALAALAVRRWGGSPHSQESVIAVVVTGLEDSRVALGRNYFGEPEIIDAVKAQAERMGYKVEFFRLHDYRNPESLKRILIARGIKGLLLTGAHPPPSMKLSFLDTFASVMFGLSFAKPFTHAVESDWNEAIRIAFTTLRNSGYKRIGAVLRPYSLREKRDIILARVLLEREDLAHEAGPQPAVLQLPEDELKQQECFNQWFRQEMPDALIASKNTVLEWARAATPKGSSLPGFVCLYNQGVGHDPRVNCIHHPHHEEGAEAVRMLDHLLRYRLIGIPRYPMQIMVAPSWADGESSRSRSKPERASRSKASKK